MTDSNSGGVVSEPSYVQNDLSRIGKKNWEEKLRRKIGKKNWEQMLRKAEVM